MLKFEDEVDFWEVLATENQVAIDEGLEPLDKGKYDSGESVQKEIESRFNF